MVLFRPPVRMRPGSRLAPPAQLPQPAASQTSVDFGELLKKMDEVLKAYGGLQAVLDAAKALETKMASVKEGPRGAPGRDAYLDVEDLAQRAAALVPAPKDGKSPKLNYEKLARHSARHIKPPAGAPGKDADVAVAIASVLEHLKTGKVKIKAEHVEGLKQTTEVIRRFEKSGGIRGGGDTVAAGTNVTITRLTSGAVQISAQAGFTALDPTETPNGSRTVFTFATATAKPSYIISDNVLMKATAKSGTVNWTWSSALKQATMTVPPQDDIEGIV